MKLILLCAVFLLAGCGTKVRVKADVNPGIYAPGANANLDVKVDTPAMPSPVPTHVYSKFYTVEKGDCLWTIAGKKQVYGNAFEWPLLWKANRDLISDPDLIEPKQVLSYPRMVDDFEETEAVLIAQHRPKYHKQ